MRESVSLPGQQGEEDGANHHLMVVLRSVGVAKDDDHLHDPACYEHHEPQVHRCAGLQPHNILSQLNTMAGNTKPTCAQNCDGIMFAAPMLCRYLAIDS